MTAYEKLAKDVLKDWGMEETPEKVKLIAEYAMKGYGFVDLELMEVA